MNINPQLWGPGMWKSLHYITLGYPDNPNSETKNNMKNLFISLQYVLPCEKCRYNFGNHLNKYPLDDNVLSSKQNLVAWLIDVHNEVNKSLGKSTLSRNSAIESFSNNTNLNNGTIFDFRIATIILSIILIIVIIVILKLRNN